MPDRLATCCTAALLILLCATAARATQTAPKNRKPSVPTRIAFTDEIGRRVKVPADVRRIVSLAPNLTEIVFALGAGDRLVGDTDFCDFPAEAKQKPHVGGPVNPNLEQIARLMPDLVLATAINRRETVDALDRLGIPVYAVDPHSVEGMISSIEHIGAALQADESAAALADELRTRMKSIAQRLQGIETRRAFFVVWTDPLISIGDHTFLADALRRAGARSVLDTSQEWPRVSLEEIVRLQPDYLIFADDADAATLQTEIDALRKRPGWRELSALQNDRVVIVSDAINRPAPRMVDAIEQLARGLHPEAFASLPPAFPERLGSTEEACACAR